MTAITTLSLRPNAAPLPFTHRQPVVFAAGRLISGELPDPPTRHAPRKTLRSRGGAPS